VAAADYEYVVVGHVTIDVREETGSRKPGGTALYSGLQAARLGCRTLIVTAGDRDEIGALLAPYANEFDIVVQPRTHTTTFATSGFGFERRQRRIAWAGPIEDPGELEAPIVHVAPIARETGLVTATEASFVGITPQGLVRSWSEAGEPIHVELDPALLPPRYDAIVLDELERTLCAPTVERAVRAGITVVVTAADEGVELLSAGVAPVRLAAFEPTALVDDLGAGDVVAAAFFVALRERRDPAAAAHFAQAAACIRLAGSGPEAVPRRGAIEVLAGTDGAGCASRPG
jgi:sugar/nucleoside kinase (ribokinase family)